MGEPMKSGIKSELTNYSRENTTERGSEDDFPDDSEAECKSPLLTL